MKLTEGQVRLLLAMHEDGMHIVPGDNGTLWLTAWHADPDGDVRLCAADVDGLVEKELLDRDTHELTDLCVRKLDAVLTEPAPTAEEHTVLELLHDYGHRLALLDSTYMIIAPTGSASVADTALIESLLFKRLLDAQTLTVTGHCATQVLEHDFSN